jgi:hypothetical protein
MAEEKARKERLHVRKRDENARKKRLQVRKRYYVKNE